MPKAVIFDVDGTLLDFSDMHARSWQDAFRVYGCEAPFGDIRSQIGKGRAQLMPVFLSEDDIEAWSEEQEEHRGQILKDRYLMQVQPFPGVGALLQRVRADGVRVVIASYDHSLLAEEAVP